MRFAGRAATVILISILCAMPVAAQSNAELQKELEAIRKELQEIKRLLQSRPAPAAAELPRQPIDISLDPVKGEAAAKVALIEYSDYQCPFCSRFGRDAYPQLDEAYIRTGKVKYVFRDLPLDFHKQAFKAAEAAHCAGEQGKFWEMHDQLFANQKQLGVEDLQRHAATLGLDAPRFQQCLDSGRFGDAIRKDIREANSAGISGTPTFLIGTVNADGTVQVKRKLVGAKPYSEFRTAIDELLSVER
ncbi:MAG TPA: DsbA family protein [Thermoanaerobaculia bacterium]|nr:DsbA family protein [Thermoanaerobaculia bacterium]